MDQQMFSGVSFRELVSLNVSFVFPLAFFFQHERTTERMNERTNEGTKERTNERASERKKKGNNRKFARKNSPSVSANEQT